MPTADLDRRRVLVVISGLMLVMLLASLDQTIVSTALPTIVRELGGLEHLSWVVTAYLLAVTAVTPLYGKLGDLFGRKIVLQGALVLFLAGSALCGLAQGMTELIAFRFIQGLGGGGLMVSAQAAVGDVVPPADRGRYTCLFGAVFGVSSIAGPVLGGFLTTHVSWRSIFYVNLPFGALGFAVLAWKYHDREKPHSTDLDLPGVTLLAVASTALLALVSGLGPGGWDNATSVALLVLAAASIVVFIRTERRAANPVLPPDLVIHRTIGPSLLGSLLLGICFLSLDTYVPLYVQGARGGGAAAAAGVVTPVMLTWAASGLFAAPLAVRWGFRNTAVLGSVLTVVSFTGLVVCAVTGAPRTVLTGVLLLSGLGFGPASMAYILAAQNAVTWQQRGIITSGIQFFRTIGGAVGIGVLGMVFNVLTASQFERLRTAGINPAQLMDPHGRAKLPPDALRAASGTIGHGLTWVFGFMLVSAVAQVLVTLFMPNIRADHVVTRTEAMEAMVG